MSQPLSDTQVCRDPFPFAAVPYVLKHSASQMISCMSGLRAAFDAMPDADKLRFMAILKEDPTLGVGADLDFDSAFAALSTGVMRHAVALLNLVDFVHSVRH